MEKSGDGKYVRRIKVYNKFLALLQSETAMKGIGMNTNAIFHPSLEKENNIRATQDHGWTRIEISYYAHSVEEENKFWDGYFIQDASHDIELTLMALNRTEGIRFTLPMDLVLKCWE